MAFKNEKKGVQEGWEEMSQFLYDEPGCRVDCNVRRDTDSGCAVFRMRMNAWIVVDKVGDATCYHPVGSILVAWELDYDGDELCQLRGISELQT